MSRRRPPPRGFAIPIALFVIILGAVLAVSIALLSGTQQLGAAQDLLASRAYQAARAGAEWGVHRALRDDPGAACGDIGAGVGRTFAVSAIAGFSVTVTCAESSHNEAGESRSMYVVTATACNLVPGPCLAGVPGSATYVERQLQVVVGSE
jgi:MSHA biogenesis protein MshP